MNRRTEVKNDAAWIERALRRWDPIGVFRGPKDEQAPLSEYDGFALPILGQLQRGADASQLGKHLATIRTADMGLEADQAADDAVGRELETWWKSRSDR